MIESKLLIPTNLSITVNQNTDAYETIFKKLYYHLYTNSAASRAERIIEDLSKILLCKLAIDRKALNGVVTKYLEGIGTANNDLLPALNTVFPDIIQQNDFFSLGDAAIRDSLSLIMSLDLHSTPAHVIGDAFQGVMGPRLRGDKGQFFTPRPLVKAMVSIVGVNDGDTVVDPACGTGGFLSEVGSRYDNVHLIGIDKDRDLWRLATALLEISTNSSVKVFNTNSLDIKYLEQLSISTSLFSADIVLTNPPFGSRIGVTDRSILSQFELGHYWVYSKSDKLWKRQTTLRKSQDPQILFIELCIRFLKPEGKLGIVLPEGVFGNKSSGYVWSFLQSQGQIISLLDCPRTTFQPSTDTKTNVVFFQKSTARQQKTFWVGVAVNCGHDRRGRKLDSEGKPFRDDFAELSTEYSNKESSLTRWTECSIPKDDYFVPRYYDQSVEKELNTLKDKYGGYIVSLHELQRKKHIHISKGHEVGSEAYGTGNIPFVRTSDISNLEINPNPDKGLSDAIYENYKSLQNLEAGSILLVVDGRYRIGRTAIITEHNMKCVVQSHLRIIKVASDAPINSYELLYILNMQPILNQMRNLVFIQSTLGSLGKRLLELKIVIPERNKEWLAQIQQFKHIILTRSQLLSELHSMQPSEIEL